MTFRSKETLKVKDKFKNIFWTLFISLGLCMTAPNYGLCQTQSLITPIVPGGRQTLYSPLAGLSGFIEWDLAVVNRSSASTAIDIIIYESGGSPRAVTETVLAPRETRHIDLKSLTLDAGAASIGGVEITFNGQAMGVGAQVTVSGFRGAGNVDAPVFSDMMYKSNVSDSVWWQPGDCVSYLILGNSSDTTLLAYVTYDGGDAKSIYLAPHATRIESLNSVESTRPGIHSVHVAGTGDSGTLRATGYTVSEHQSYVDTIRFYDPASSTEPTIYANGLHKGSTHHLVVKNLSPGTITVAGAVFPINLDGSVTPIPIESKILEAGSDTELTLPSTRGSLEDAAIKLESSGSRASIVASYSSHDEQSGVTQSIPFKDIGDFAVSTGDYPWRLDGDYSSRVFLTNVGKIRAAIGAYIRPVSGPEYFIDTRYLEVGETVIFDLRKIRDEQIPDPHGVTLPKDATTGQFWWNTIFGDGNQRFIGRNEVVDIRSGVSASFSCNSCNCPSSNTSGGINPGSVAVIIDGFVTGIAAFGNLTDTCTGTGAGTFTITPTSWSTPTYFTVSSGKPTSTMTGVSSGSSSYYTPFTGIAYAWNGGTGNCFVAGYPVVNPGGQGKVSPRIDALSPPRGLIGNAVPVIILGKGFGLTPIVTAGSGTSVTIAANSQSCTNSDGTICAVFSIASNATRGATFVTVQASSTGASSPPATFYVQVPTKLVRLDYVGCPSGYCALKLTSATGGKVQLADGTVVATNQCGVYRNVIYSLLDQATPAMAINGSFTLAETFSGYTSTFGGTVPPNVNNTLSPGGVIDDIQYIGKTQPACPSSSDNESFNQATSVKIGSVPYPLSLTNHISRGYFSGVAKVDITIQHP